MELALFLTGGLWVLAARSAAEHAAQGFTTHFLSDLFEPLLSGVFLLFLLLVGFTIIHWIATRSATVRGVNSLPLRSSARAEWRLGAALGWSMLIAAILPMAITLSLHPNFWWQPRGFGLVLLSLVTLLVFTLAVEATFRGYLFSRLVRALGPTLASLFVSAVYASMSQFHPQASGLSFVVTFVFSLVLCMAYLRTHALWLPWGLHYAWAASMGVLFGLPVGGFDMYSSVVDTSVTGPAWLTGGFYGPEGALLTVLVALVAMPILYRLTRDFAWQYTHTPIVAAGYAMDVAPPAEHVKMEQAASAAPLVQILSTTSTTSSTMPVIDQHLRSTLEADTPLESQDS